MPETRRIRRIRGWRGWRRWEGRGEGKPTVRGDIPERRGRPSKPERPEHRRPSMPVII